MSATTRAASAMLALALCSLSPSFVAAQSADIPSTWIDISDRAPAFDELVEVSRRAAASESFWVGYVFPLRGGVHIACDDRRGRTINFDSDGVSLYLERDADDAVSTSCDDDFGLFLRFDGNTSEVAEARMLTMRRAARRLDETVVWAGGYDAARSVEFLRDAILADRSGTRAITASSEKVRERILSAVAVHDDATAVEAVFDGLNTSYPEQLRESALFWASQVGGDEGLVRLLELARSDRAVEMRKQSIFWLGQVAGERATADLAEIAEDDPDTDVRTSAVFALSQSDDDAAVDALIRIVRTHDSREVVKAALFWLGQSDDPRVIAFFEELLFGGRQ